MSEKLLLLSEAKSGVLVHRRSLGAAIVRAVALSVGVFVIVVGVIDVGNKIGSVVDHQMMVTAFAPAATLYTSTSSVPFVPVRLRVQALSIDAPVIKVGNKADGSMDTPKKFSEVAWYKLGPKVGEPGNAVFAGHVNNALMTEGVFFHLGSTKVGERIEVVGEKGESRVYEVTEIANYAADNAPLETIFTSLGPSRLVLITCEGEWDVETRSFSRRIVVFAKPAY